MGAKYNAKNRESIRAKRREAWANNTNGYRDKSSDHLNQWRYGVTPEQYQAMLDGQDNRCAICLEEFAKRPHVDHDHATGKVRGLLCPNCNSMLGRVRDSPETLQRAVEYLKRNMPPITA